MKICDHCGKVCQRRVPAMLNGSVAMVGTGCAKSLKRPIRSDFALDFSKKKKIRLIVAAYIPKLKGVDKYLGGYIGSAYIEAFDDGTVGDTKTIHEAILKDGKRSATYYVSEKEADYLEKKIEEAADLYKSSNVYRIVGNGVKSHDLFLECIGEEGRYPVTTYFTGGAVSGRSELNISNSRHWFTEKGWKRLKDKCKNVPNIKICKENTENLKVIYIDEDQIVTDGGPCKAPMSSFRRKILTKRGWIK